MGSYECKWMYNGEWQYNKMHGKGVMKYANGNKYTGYFSNNLKHGLGRYFDNKGHILYMGGWYKDRPNKYGIYIILMELCN